MIYDTTVKKHSEINVSVQIKELTLIKQRFVDIMNSHKIQYDMIIYVTNYVRILVPTEWVET